VPETDFGSARRASHDVFVSTPRELTRFGWAAGVNPPEELLRATDEHAPILDVFRHEVPVETSVTSLAPPTERK
jgi:hypothetical protein